MPISPADVIAGTLRRAGVPNPDVVARTVAADLAGHSLLAETGKPKRGKQADAGPKPKCQNPVDPHSGTDLVGTNAPDGGHCPICGWSPNDTPTTTTGA